eukprot:TRINITY_DN24749_c0_g1_i1.p1 TRINITY_DN24749_c0_g1~~TRINITY_DN24749_c0_g1_i1.p1  ORF type:complete len:581 (+),score=128.29 TRINITY_DN24749_c0_g1_i1:47-1789(+)
MPLSVAKSAGSLPTHSEPGPNLRPVVVHSSLEKKLQGVVVYGCTVVDKVSTKWRKQRRLLIATTGLLLVCTIEGKVNRVIDMIEIDELLVQSEKSCFNLLVKLASTPSNEPDFLCTITPNKRNTHNSDEFLSILSTLVQHRNPSHHGIRMLPQNAGSSAIKGMARLGHNPISAKEKIRMCGNSRMKNQPTKNLSNLMEIDSRPTSSTVTPVILPTAATPVEKPLEFDTVDQPSLLGGFNLYNDASNDNINTSAATDSHKLPQPTSFTTISDHDVIAHSRLRAGSSVSIAEAGSAASSDPPKRQRAVSFSNTTIEIANASPATTDGGEDLSATMSSMKPVQHAGFASSMPPIKSLPEDDEGGCGWTEHKDPVSKLTYYHNDKLQKSTWHEPEELKAWKKRNGFPTQASSDSDEEERKSNEIYEKTLALSKKSTTLKGLSKGVPLLVDESEIQSDNDDDDDDDGSSSDDTDTSSSDDSSSEHNSYTVPKRLSVIPAKSKKLDIASLLDGPPVKVLKSRIPTEVIQPSFDEQPFDSPSASVGTGGIAHNRAQRLPNVQLNPIKVDMHQSQHTKFMPELFDRDL